MPERDPTCLLCRDKEADEELHTVEVWSDDHWRLKVSLLAEVSGFAYLIPRRHIRYVTELDGPEAQTLGPVLARASAALQEASGAELVYVYVFGGGVPHLHIHLAPHREGDALSSQMIKGDPFERKLDSGVTIVTSDRYPPLPENQLRTVAGRVRDLLAAS